MALEKLEHCLILSSDLDATRRFYCDVLGMTVGFRPQMSFSGFWIYLGDTAVIHVASLAEYLSRNDADMTQPPVLAVGSGAIDHIAFTGTDPAAIEARLKEHQIVYERNEIAEINLVQLFALDPDGVRVEMNFTV